MVINLLETTQIVLGVVCMYLLDALFTGQVDQVSCAKLVGITFKQHFQFDAHVTNNILKLCSQRLYLFTHSRSWFFTITAELNCSLQLVNIVILYRLPTWSGFLSAELVSMVNFLFKRAFRYGYSNSLQNSAMMLRKLCIER